MRDTRTKRGKTKIEGGFSRLDLTDWTEPLTWADPRAIYLDMCIDRVHHLLHLYVFKKRKKSSRNNRFFFWFLLSWNQKMQRGHEGICCSPPPISIGEARTLVLSLCAAGSVWLGQRIFWEGERERATPRRVRLLCTRSLAAKGQRDSARPRCETWLETCQSGRKEGWAKVKVPKNQKYENPSTKKDRHVHI